MYITYLYCKFQVYRKVSTCKSFQEETQKTNWFGGGGLGGQNGHIIKLCEVQMAFVLASSSVDRKYTIRRWWLLTEMDADTVQCVYNVFGRK